MPSTIITEEIELIHSGKGPGGGNFSGNGGNGGNGFGKFAGGGVAIFRISFKRAKNNFLHPGRD